MNRQTQLMTALHELYSPDEIQNILNYEVSKQDLETVTSIAVSLLKAIPRLSSQCASMSACWSSAIKSQTSIPVCVVTGHLHIADAPLFTQNTPISFSKEDDGNPKQWDGHCWIEFGGYIGDMSIFRTIYSQDFPHPNFKQFLINKFGEKRGFMIANSEQMKSWGLIYTPVNILADAEINSLIAGLHCILESNKSRLS